MYKNMKTKETYQPLKFRWGNNSKRATMKGRECKVIVYEKS